MPATHPDELAEGISRVMGDVNITSLQRLTGGASRETWRFECGGEGFVLQRVRPGRPNGLGCEPAVLAAAFASGVPVPEVIVDGSSSTELDLPFMIVRAVQGETIARKILRDEEFATARQRLPQQLGDAAARIHHVDMSSISGLESSDQVTMYRKVLDDLGEPHPVFEIAFRWLEQHRPPSTAQSLVHGDFRLGNVLVGGEGLTAVLDWELAHIGDPMEDLGWLCVRAWRFGGQFPVAGLGEYNALFDSYEQASGVRPDFSVVRWWEILGTLKWGIMCIVQANTHLSGLARSHELAAIGRRVCENEYDILHLLREELS
jgi:aminoglycoside phosphotransferase (APT) family kinase protein